MFKYFFLFFNKNFLKQTYGKKNILTIIFLIYVEVSIHIILILNTNKKNKNYLEAFGDMKI